MISTLDCHISDWEFKSQWILTPQIYFNPTSLKMPILPFFLSVSMHQHPHHGKRLQCLHCCARVFFVGSLFTDRANNSSSLEVPSNSALEVSTASLFLSHSPLMHQYIFWLSQFHSCATARTRLDTPKHRWHSHKHTPEEKKKNEKMKRNHSLFCILSAQKSTGYYVSLSVCFIKHNVRKTNQLL